MQALNKSAAFGRTAELKARSPAPVAVRCPVVVRAEQVEVRDPPCLSRCTPGSGRVVPSQYDTMLPPAMPITTGCDERNKCRHPVADVDRRRQVASQVSRRAGLGMLAAGAALLTRTAPSEAAYGESANIFGKATNTAGPFLVSHRPRRHVDNFLCSAGSGCTSPC